MNLVSRAERVGVAVGRSGPIVETNHGQFVDLTGGQHALLFSHWTETHTARLLASEAHDWIGVSRHFDSSSAESLAKWTANYAEEPGLRSFFVSGGTEGFELALAVALRIARAERRDRPAVVAGLTESYHGFSLAALSAADHPLHTPEPSSRGGLGWKSMPRESLLEPDETTAALTRVFERENVIAFIYEPVGGTTSGAVPIDHSVMAAIKKTCDAYGVVVICDEVVTGFGRTGRPFAASEHLFDIRIAGKLLGGGIVPIVAVSFSTEFVKRVQSCDAMPGPKPTHNNNGFVARLALNLQRMRSSELDEGVIALGERLHNGLTSEGLTVRGRGLLRAVVFSHRQPLARLRHLLSSAAQSGLVIMGGSSATQMTYHFMVTPALDSRPEDIDLTVQRLSEFVNANSAAGNA